MLHTPMSPLLLNLRFMLHFRMFKYTNLLSEVNYDTYKTQSEQSIFFCASNVLVASKGIVSRPAALPHRTGPLFLDSFIISLLLQLDA
jgi:hypothetical protein